MKKKKFIIVILIAILVFGCFNSLVYAFDVEDINGNMPKEAKGATEGIENIGQNTIKVLSTIGSIVSVVTLVVLGIKYMFGSVEEKAAYKKSLLPYVIGACSVFAASVLVSIIYNIARKL